MKIFELKEIKRKIFDDQNFVTPESKFELVEVNEMVNDESNLGQEPERFPILPEYEKYFTEHLLLKIGDKIKQNKFETHIVSVYKPGIYSGGFERGSDIYLIPHAKSPKSFEDSKVYSELEDKIIGWNIDGTKTAGALTRAILKTFEVKFKK